MSGPAAAGLASAEALFGKTSADWDSWSTSEDYLAASAAFNDTEFTAHQLCVYQKGEILKSALLTASMSVSN